jgi:hypothetical protein
MKYAAVVLAAVSATALTVPTASADHRKPHALDGRVCLFDAPRVPWHLGHIGWAYRWSGHRNQWDYGATVGVRQGWREHGTFEQMVAAFRASRDAEGYDSYRCKNTVSADQHDANGVVNLLNGKDYNLMVNNCLTKSVQILKAYDHSGGLNGMSDGRWTPPNLYFSQSLDKAGWDGAIKLR